MTAEVTPELSQADQLKIARQEFMRAIISTEFDSTQIVGRVIDLQNLLYQSDLQPQVIFHELQVSAEQAAYKARAAGDEEVSLVLDGMKSGYELTLRNFEPKSVAQITESPQPTRTESLPAMTSPKGEARPETRPTRASAQTTQAEPAPQSTSVPEQNATEGATSAKKPLRRGLQNVLNILREVEEPTSGNELAYRLNVSPAGAMSYISELRRSGYNVESVHDESGRKTIGYRLAEAAPQEQADNQSQ